MADTLDEKSSEAKQKKEKRAAESEDKDTISQKKQRLSDDAEFVCNTKEIISKENKSILKRPHADDADNFQDSSKKFKLEASTADKDVMEDGAHQESKKSYHRRMKHTLNCVLEQMEFYFSDTNLSKDRFLKRMVDISPDGYVDLFTFSKFNKLQSLHKDGISRNVMIQALSRSKVLQLNDDKTKVKRIIPFQEISQDETDKRTVYVEYLPTHATHMWVKQVFSQCGKVAYVSLPTYKTSKQIKGFAFVEFTTPEEAERACVMLNNPLPDKAMERPGKFPKTNKTLDKLQSRVPLNSAGDGNEENNPVEKQEESKADTEVKKKKKKKAKKKKPQDSSAEESSTQTGQDTKEQKPEGKKKKKKKKRKQSQLLENCTEGELPGSEQSELATETQDKKKLKKEQATEADVGKEDKDYGGETKTEADVEHTAKKPKMSAEKSEENPGTVSSAQSKKRNKKRKKSKGEASVPSEKLEKRLGEDEKSTKPCGGINSAGKMDTALTTPTQVPTKKLSHKERKLLRQEDIRRKKQQKLQCEEVKHKETTDLEKSEKISPPSEELSKEQEGSQPTSILKMKKAAEKKRVEFDPVPITTEFVEAKGARKRKKSKREKPHLRVISKKDWVSLKEEYISQQKSHMKALKESLRELRQQENAEAGRPKVQQTKTVDLEEVFGTKPLKLSHEDKMAHVEKMKFTPNVIVQWWCSHEMHRDKIRTMFKESHASSIAYIDANEEARSGYIRFKDEASAEEFAKMSRNSTSFMARVLPADQQEEYWEKANRDRMNKLGRKKKEQGCDRIARKMFQRNKATFFNKPSRIVFDDAEDDANNANNSGKGVDENIS